MNRRLFHRWMSHWAFAAILALALVPSVGRLAGQSAMPMHPMAAAGSIPDHSADTGHAGHSGHTGKTGAAPTPTDGVMTHEVAHALDTLSEKPAAGNGHHGSDDDCAYCPLLLGTTALPVPGLQAALPLHCAVVPIPEIRVAALDRHPTGLGSRGPPLPA